MAPPITTEFETEKDFILFLSSLRLLPEKAREDMIQHEKEHYDAARVLGFNPKYAVSIYYEGNKLKSVKASIILETNDNPAPEETERLKRVLSAPRTMSPSDKRELESLINPYVFESVSR